MTDGDALLKAILANPDEDTPRLVYADWLQENGDDDRAEFIRLQVEIAKMDGLPASQTVVVRAFRGRPPGHRLTRVGLVLDGMRKREMELFALQGPNQVEWMGGPATHYLPVAGSEWANHLHWFRRGFVERVETDAACWLLKGDGVLEENPVREVALTTYPNYAFRDGAETRGVGDISKGVNYLAGCFMLEWPGVKFTMPRAMSPQEMLDEGWAVSLVTAVR